ncbi:jg23521 [Pararge aegeria aegeria]|uniref:Jg23521 protein n=1 Tax=Pararge aegeria aegeria TaxID=348720 RepID=A0A8S4QYX8_9NEOP|nr:jg23521 [Pararge aegeria aegeria]
MQWAGHVQRMEGTRAQKRLMEGTWEGRRGRGRPEYLTVMRIEEDPFCSVCGEVETSFHFKAECPMYALVRWEVQGRKNK